MYSRMLNENGSYNSRCLDCFMTIASYVATEEEMGRREAGHLCPEKVLRQMAEREFLNAEGVKNDAARPPN